MKDIQFNIWHDTQRDELGVNCWNYNPFSRVGLHCKIIKRIKAKNAQEAVKWLEKYAADNGYDQRKETCIFGK